MYKLPAFIALLVLIACHRPEKAVTKAEALQFGKSLDSCIRKRNGRAFDELFNSTLLTKRLKGNNILSETARARGIRDGLKKAGLGNQIINTLKSRDDSYALIKHYEVNGMQHLIYRLQGDGGLNYHDFELERHGGKVYIADMYIYTSGENFSKTLSDFLETSGDWDSKQKKGFHELDKIKQLYLTDRNIEAKKQFDKLDPEFTKQKSVQLIYVLICSKLDEKTYLEALDKYVAQYPNESNTFLLMLDVCFLKKDYDKASIYVEKLDSLIDKDPFLDYYRGLIVKSKGNPGDATKYLENLYVTMPEFSAGIIELIANYLDLEKYEQAKHVIKYYRDHDKFNQETLDYVLVMYPGYKE